MTATADIILLNGRITTLRPSRSAASGFSLGRNEDVLPFAGATTRQIDLAGRRVIPGLIDSHMHIIRGGLNYNMELRWDGVRSPRDAMRSPLAAAIMAAVFMVMRMPQRGRAACRSPIASHSGACSAAPAGSSRAMI